MIKKHHKYYKNKILAITYWTQVNQEHATLIPNEEEECHGGFSVTKPKIILINELNNNNKKNEKMLWKKWKVINCENMFTTCNQQHYYWLLQW